MRKEESYESPEARGLFARVQDGSRPASEGRQEIGDADCSGTRCSSAAATFVGTISRPQGGPFPDRCFSWARETRGGRSGDCSTSQRACPSQGRQRDLKK